jgi:hypothetical protein
MERTELVTDCPGVALERTELPAVVTAGGYDLQHRFGDLCQELDSGAEVHLVGLQTGRHRGWLLRQKPDGSSPERLMVSEMKRSIGLVLELVRDGVVYEVYQGKKREVIGYLTWGPPDCLAQLDLLIPYTQRGPYTARTRHIRPLAVQAEPVPRRFRRSRRAVLASA